MCYSSLHFCLNRTVVNRSWQSFSSWRDLYRWNLWIDPGVVKQSGAKYEPIAKAQLKKITKLWQQEVKRRKCSNNIKELNLKIFEILNKSHNAKLKIHYPNI